MKKTERGAEGQYFLKKSNMWAGAQTREVYRGKEL